MHFFCTMYVEANDLKIRRKFNWNRQCLFSKASLNEILDKLDEFFKIFHKSKSKSRLTALLQIQIMFHFSENIYVYIKKISRANWYFTCLNPNFLEHWHVIQLATLQHFSPTFFRIQAAAPTRFRFWRNTLQNSAWYRARGGMPHSGSQRIFETFKKNR